LANVANKALEQEITDPGKIAYSDVNIRVPIPVICSKLTLIKQEKKEFKHFERSWNYKRDNENLR
jgi:hypothetical protein